jgi:hypothetical protein
VTPPRTTAPPTVPGWYWRRDQYGILDVVEVEGDGSYLAVDDPDLGFQPVSCMGGEWSGPLAAARRGGRPVTPAALSETDLRALRILAERGPVRPLRFAEFMWPESDGWKRVKNCGNHGASRGVGMSLAGAGLLGKLRRRGLAESRYGRVSGRLDCLGYGISADGLRAMSGRPNSEDNP